MGKQQTDEVLTKRLNSHCKLCEDGLLEVRAFDVVESTMGVASQFIQDSSINDNRIYAAVARSQSAGRGRAGRNWVSVSDHGLYVTFCLSAKDKGPAHWSGFSLAVGVAIRRALGKMGYSVRLKWPNDIAVLADNLRGYKKLGGVLIDLQKGPAEQNWLLVGIGLNISAGECIRVVEGISLEELSEPAPSLEELFSLLAEELISCHRSYLDTAFSSFADEWRAASIMKGARVVIDGNQQATVVDIDERGGLLVVDDQRKESILYGGEVEVRRVVSN